jgi:hypothetical protein
MAKRVQALCAHLVEHHGGDASSLWETAGSGAELLARLKALPGFGDEKARIFTAVLAKRVGVRPPGWEEAAGPFADDSPRSVADVDSPESFTRVRAWKQAQRQAGQVEAGLRRTQTRTTRVARPARSANRVQLCQPRAEVPAWRDLLHGGRLSAHGSAARPRGPGAAVRRSDPPVTRSCERSSTIRDRTGDAR